MRPPHPQPVVDPKTGRITPEWLKYLDDLDVRITLGAVGEIGEEIDEEPPAPTPTPPTTGGGGTGSSGLPLHHGTHEAGGGDPIKLDDLAAPDDTTDLDVSTATHGLAPKLSGVAEEFLNGAGDWVVGPGGPEGPEGPEGPPGPEGPQGPAGKSAVLPYRYSSALTEPPTISQVRFDSLTYVDVTKVWFHNLTRDNEDVYWGLMLIPEGSVLLIQNDVDHTHYVEFATLGPAVDKTTYVEFAVNFVAGGVVLAHNETVLFRASGANVLQLHHATHEAGGTDAIKLDDLAPPDNTTDLNASTTAHGLLPKLSGVTTEFLNGAGLWAGPAGSGGPHHATHEVGGTDQITGPMSVSSITAPTGAFGSLGTTPLNADQLTSGTVPDARIPNAALLNAANYFTADQRINKIAPRISFISTDQPANSRRFTCLVSGDKFFVQAVNDAESTASGFISVNRGGDLYLSGGRLQFPAVQNPSTDVNTFDDYREGPWTPTILIGGSSAGVTYSSQVGTYAKAGKLCVGTCYIDLTSKGAGAGAVNIGGLPFPAQNVANGYAGSAVQQWNNFATPWSVVWGLIVPGTSTMILRGAPGGGATSSATGVQATDLTNSSSFLMTIMYITQN